MPDKDMQVIWPLYFDAKRSRSDGRAVSLSDAVKDPSIDDIITAALRAGFKPEIEREKRHPKNWHECAGRILIPKKGPKSGVIRKIARSLKSKKKS